MHLLLNMYNVAERMTAKLSLLQWRRFLQAKLLPNMKFLLNNVAPEDAIGVLLTLYDLRQFVDREHYL